MSFDLQDNWADARDFLKPGVTWRKSDNSQDGLIYCALVKDSAWDIRLNDFPDEPMFSLIVDGREVIHFNEWPLEWGVRPKLS